MASDRLDLALLEEVVEPEGRELLRGGVLAEAAPEEGEVHRVQRLVLVEAAEDERRLARRRVHVTLEALGADFLQHALHRGS